MPLNLNHHLNKISQLLVNKVKDNLKVRQSRLIKTNKRRNKRHKRHKRHNRKLNKMNQLIPFNLKKKKKKLKKYKNLKSKIQMNHENQRTQ